MPKYVLNRMDGIRTLVTGGLGFVGSNLAHKLVELGADVTLYDALIKEFGGNLFNIRDIRDRVNIVIGDIRNFNLLKQYIKDQDLLFHCAAQLSRVDSMSNPYLDIDINCRGTISVLEAIRRFNDNVKMVYTSTRATIGRPSYLPADENTPEVPMDLYGANKLVAEKYCLIYTHVHGLWTTLIRLNNSYGPRAQMKRSNYGVVSWFIRLALEGKPITVFRPGTQLRDYNYVDDVVDALILSAQNEKAKGQVFLLGSGRPISLIDLAKLIVEIAGQSRVEMVSWPSEWKKIEIGNFYVSFEKIERMLGWHPKTELRQGVKKTIEFYRENLHEYI